MTPPQSTTVSSETKVSVKLLLALCATFLIPMVTLGVFNIRKLDSIESKIVLLTGAVSRNETKLGGHVTRSQFDSFIREARALGYPDLPDLPR